VSDAGRARDKARHKASSSVRHFFRAVARTGEHGMAWEINETQGVAVVYMNSNGVNKRILPSLGISQMRSIGWRPGLRICQSF
jgi:hypothetical protein